jgi:hypothetical protein
MKHAVFQRLRPSLIPSSKGFMRRQALFLSWDGLRTMNTQILPNLRQDAVVKR